MSPVNATEYRPEYCGPARCRYAPVGEKGKPRHARPGPHRTISRSGSRTETRNVPSTSAWLRDEACPRGSGTEVERPNDRRTEAWRRASGTAPCRERRAVITIIAVTHRPRMPRLGGSLCRSRRQRIAGHARDGGGLPGKRGRARHSVVDHRPPCCRPSLCSQACRSAAAHR
jgi:hypothetical protein